MPRPARPWFRFYSETLHNRKARALLATDPGLYGQWTLLLCLANITDPRGYLPRSIDDIAYQLRANVDQTAAILDALKVQGFITARARRLQMHDWDEWQPGSDANLTPGRATKNERTRKERVKNAEPPRLERVKNAVARRRSETETETEKEAEAEETRARDPAGQVMPPRLPIMQLAERSFGRLLSPMEIESLKHLDKEHPYDRIEYAFRVAADNNAKKVRYVQAVCEGEEKNGDSHERERSREGDAATSGVTSERIDAELAKLGPRPEFVLD